MPGPVTQTTARSVKPFLKWAGGKSQLLSQYERFFPTHFNAYHEPFLGSGAVFFHLQSQGRIGRAVLSDSNEELINCYVQIRDNLPSLLNLLREHQEQHSRAHYYRTRSRIPADPLERAARLLYLNKTCYNGLYRLNASGEFNVPMGRYENPRILNEALLWTASDLLQGAVLSVEEFSGVTRRAALGDFVYFDPPYHPLSATSNFTAYTGGVFTEEDQERLRDVFAALAHRGVSVMLSNSDTPLIRDLYRPFRIAVIRARRTINTDPCRRGCVREVLVTSYPSTPS